MVKSLLRRVLPVCAAFFLAACTDMLRVSIFPSYLPALDAVADLQGLLPEGRSVNDYYVRIWPLRTQEGRRYLVLGIKQMFFDGGPDFYLLFDDDLRYLRRLDAEGVYGSGQMYDIAAFATSAPEGNDLLLGFDGPVEALVFIDPLSGVLQKKQDTFSLINRFRDSLSTGVVISAEKSVWFFRNTVTNEIEFLTMKSGSPLVASKFFTIFGMDSTEEGGILLGAAPNADRTGVIAFFQGDSSEKVYAFSTEDPDSEPNILFPSDDTNFPALRVGHMREAYPTGSGLVVIPWDEDWRFYKTDGRVFRKSMDDLRDGVHWGFSPEGDFYYLLDKKRAQLFKMRAWW